jgi:hypothetical protein
VKKRQKENSIWSGIKSTRSSCSQRLEMTSGRFFFFLWQVIIFKFTLKYLEEGLVQLEELIYQSLDGG